MLSLSQLNSFQRLSTEKNTKHLNGNFQDEDNQEKWIIEKVL